MNQNRQDIDEHILLQYLQGNADEALRDLDRRVVLVSETRTLGAEILSRYDRILGAWWDHIERNYRGPYDRHMMIYELSADVAHVFGQKTWTEVLTDELRKWYAQKSYLEVDDFAKAMGMSKSEARYLLAGQGVATDATIGRMARVFGMEPVQQILQGAKIRIDAQAVAG